MLDSKACKEIPEKEFSKFYSWWLESKIAYFYYKAIGTFFTNPAYQVKRLYDWHVNALRYDHDFDAHCLFGLIEYKLKRVQECLAEGHLEQEAKDMKAIKLAIKLAGRLSKDDYDRAVSDRMEKKWGKSRNWLTPVTDRPDITRWNQKYDRVNSEEDESRANEDRRILYISTHNKMKREEKVLYAILNKYLRNWWD